MSAPFIWIVLPGISAAVLFILQRWQRTVLLLGMLFTLMLAWLAWIQPIGETFLLGPLRFQIVDTMFVLGRRFVLLPSDIPILILLYLGTAFWFGGMIAAKAGPYFIPIGLEIVAILTAAIAVEPFLFAALLIELLTIISLPLISPPGNEIGKGTLRFLSYQTLAMPLILLAGWILEGLEGSPADSQFVLLASVLIGIGFSLLLAIFPFHTWVPMLAEETHPFVAAFIFYIFSLGITFLGIGFLERYVWLRSSERLFELFRLAGGLMVLIGGVWAAYQVHLGRLLGFAVLMETGLSLLTLGIGPAGPQLSPSVELLFTSLLPRGLSFGVWALALTAIARAHGGVENLKEGLLFTSLSGVGKSSPIATSALFLAIFSLAGFPLLAGFPVRFALWQALAGKYLVAAVLALLSSVGLTIGGIRALFAMITGSEVESWKLTETWTERIMIAVGTIAILLVGLLPQWFLPSLARMTDVFLSTHP